MRATVTFFSFWALLLNAAQAEPLTLNGVWAYALEHNPSIESVGYERGIAESGRESAASRYRPQVLLNGNVREIDRDRATTYQGLMPERKGSVSARITQQLYNLDADTAIDKAEISQTLAGLSRQSVQMDLAYAVGMSAVRIAYAQVTLDILTQRARRIQGYLDIAQHKYDAGKTDISDVYRWQSELSRINGEIAEAENAVVTGESELKNHIGMDQGDPLAFTFSPQEFDAFTNLADAKPYSNPNIDMLRERIKIHAVESRNTERKYYIPEVALSADGEQTFYRGGAGDKLPATMDNTDYRIGIDLNLRLYEGGVKASEVETLRLKQLQEKSNIRTLENALAKEQKNASESIRAYEISLAYDTESAAKAARYLQTRQQQYRQGSIDITPLLDAEEFATVADLQTEQKRYRIMQYRLLLSYAQSKLMHPFGE